MKTYSAYKLNLDGSLSHRANLNSLDELNEWISEKYGKFASVRIICDQNMIVKNLTDNGKWWEII